MRQKTVVCWVGVGNQRLMVGVRFPFGVTSVLEVDR